MSNLNKEGVIKFDLSYTPAPPLPHTTVADLISWRQVLIRLQWMGRHPNRYEGYGFGNLSRRLSPLKAPPFERRFAISGSQTGHLEPFTNDHIAWVARIDPATNHVTAAGPCPPSSESMTHGMIYALDPEVLYVMHVHAPVIWRNAEVLNLPTTSPEVPYGTPAMAEEVERLFRDTHAKGRHMFAMGGHEDGIVAYGATALIAASNLLGALTQAYQASLKAIRSHRPEGRQLLS